MKIDTFVQNLVAINLASVSVCVRVEYIWSSSGKEIRQNRLIHSSSFNWSAHIRKVLSEPPDTKNWPLGSKTTACTASSWPCSSFKGTTSPSIAKLWKKIHYFINDNTMWFLNISSYIVYSKYCGPSFKQGIRHSNHQGY